MTTVGSSSPQTSPVLAVRLKVWWNRTELEEEGAKDYSCNQFDAPNIPLSSSQGCSHHRSFSSLRFIYIGHG